MKGDLVKDYYTNNCAEDERLEKNSHKIEFITTIKYIEKYLFKGAKILEIGAATGKYAIHLAKMGYKVVAAELVSHNIEIMNERIKEENLKNITTIEANALDLSMLKDNSFDIVLNLGPMYHMYTEEDKSQVINESLRVAKEEGIVMFAYVTNFAVFWNFGCRKNRMEEIKYAIQKDFSLKDIEEEIFSVHSPEKFNELFANKPITRLHLVATDSIFETMGDYVNEMCDRDFEILKNFHLATCEQKDNQFATSHGLWIGRKTTSK